MIIININSRQKLELVSRATEVSIPIPECLLEQSVFKTVTQAAAFNYPSDLVESYFLDTFFCILPALLLDYYHCLIVGFEPTFFNY